MSATVLLGFQQKKVYTAHPWYLIEKQWIFYKRKSLIQLCEIYEGRLFAREGGCFKTGLFVYLVNMKNQNL